MYFAIKITDPVMIAVLRNAPEVQVIAEAQSVADLCNRLDEVGWKVDAEDDEPRDEDATPLVVEP